MSRRAQELLFCLKLTFPDSCFDSHIVSEQDKIFRRKRLFTGENFVHVYLEIWDKGVLMFDKLFNVTG